MRDDLAREAVANLTFLLQTRLEQRGRPRDGEIVE